MALPNAKDQGFGTYRHGHSTAGIFFQNHHEHNNNSNTTACIYILHQQFSPHHLLHPHGPFPETFTVLSSSNGYILCRCTYTFSYYFIMHPNFRTSYLPYPHRPHHISSPAVISFAHDHTLYISCVIYEGGGTYTFDVYHSYYGWLPRVCGLHIKPVYGRVRLNSGVSSYRYAYWLTDGFRPRCIMFDPRHCVVEFKDRNFPVSENSSGMKLQLGRILGDVHMAVVNGLFGRFFILKGNGEWEDLGIVLRLVGYFEENEEVVPFRFESHKFEFVYCVGGARLVLIESNDVTGVLREVDLPFSDLILAGNKFDVGNSVPYAP